MAISPNVSAIVAVSAPGPLVDETVRSIRKQSGVRWEVVIVPTGGAVNYGGIVQELSSGEAGRLGPDQLAIVRNPAASVSGAWNLGLEAARGETIFPLRAGDTLRPGALGTVAEALKECPKAAYAFFDHQVKGTKEAKDKKGVFHLPRLLKENYIDRALAMRRDTWVAVEDWDYIALGDSSWNFLLKLAHRGSWGCYVPEILAELVPGEIEKSEALVYNAPDPRRAVELLHPYFFSPQGRIAVKRLWEPSLCFVIQGDARPSFDNQTVRDFQVLRNVSEQEALEQSRAANFLWLTGDRPLQPHAAEECIWGLRAAEWVTWSDTGEAPPPSVRKCAGPLGVSRWALQTEEAKRSGEVRRLPWPCREEPRDPSVAAVAVEPEEDEIELAEPPPADQLRAGTETSGGLARVFKGRGISDWRKHPVEAVSKLIPSRFREGLGGVTVGRTFEIEGPPAAGTNADGSKRAGEPVEYMPRPAAAGRRRFAVWTPHFGVGGCEQSLFEMAGQFPPESVESFLCGVDSRDSAWLPFWRDRVEHLYDLRRILAPEAAPAFAVSFARNWRPDILLIHGIDQLHTVLVPLRNELPKARLAVMHCGSEAEKDLFGGEVEWLAAVDHHFVTTPSAAKWLYEMTVPEERISVIPPGVDCERFHSKTVDPGDWRERLGLEEKRPIVLFAGRLTAGNNPMRMLDTAARLKEMRAGNGIHFVIAGTGPLRESLESKIKSRDLAADVTLPGHVPDIRGLLAAATAVVLPAARRELPQVVLEALAMETPVVVRRGEAVASILGEGLEVASDDEEEDVAFARSLDTLLQNPDRRDELGANGRKLVEAQYSIEKTRESWRQWLAATVG